MFDFKELLDTHKSGDEISLAFNNGVKLHYENDGIRVSHGKETICHWTKAELREEPEGVLLEVMCSAYTGKACKKRRFTEFIDSIEVEWFDDVVEISAVVANVYNESNRRDVSVTVDLPAEIVGVPAEKRDVEEYFGKTRRQQSMVLQTFCHNTNKSYDGQVDLTGGELQFCGWNEYEEEDDD